MPPTGPQRKYLTLENFSFGLDTRKSKLTSQPGTLLRLENGHVNQGGEIEKRKAFVLPDTVNLYFPKGTGYCFGMEATENGIFTFGSATSGTVGTLPTGVTYQQLIHPDGATAMTSVVYSTDYNGLPWVVAGFADGNTYAYYNGTLVTDLTDGLVLASLNTNIKLATNLASIINRSTSTQGYTAIHTGTNTFADIFSPIGQAYGDIITETSAAGTLAGVLTSSNTPSVPNVAAVAQFRIVAGVAETNCKITSVKVDATASTEILVTAVAWATSNAQTAIAVAAQINSSAVSGYTAQANADLVIIFAASSTGAGSNTFKVQVTVTAPTTTAQDGLCIGDCSFSFSGVPSVTNVLANGVAITTSGPFTAADNGTLCSNIAKNINLNTGTTGYVAFVPQVGGVNQNQLLVAKKVTRSDDASVSINPTLTTGGFVGGSGVPLNITTSTLAATGRIKTSIQSNGTQVSPSIPIPITAFASGGSNNGFVYLWTVQNVVVNSPAVGFNNTNSILVQNQTTASIILSAAFSVFTTSASIIVAECFCTVTDSGGNVSTSPLVSITFTA